MDVYFHAKNQENPMYNELEKVKADLSRPYHLKYFKGCLPQILLGPFLNYLDPFLGPLWPILLHFTPLKLSAAFFHYQS